MKTERNSGILLHPTSLPGKYGIGSLGTEAFRFIDFLASAGQKLWQILPLGPTGYGDSPYQCFSSVAGNPLLINLELLVEKGLLNADELNNAPVFSDIEIDYATVIQYKYEKLETAFINFGTKANQELKKDFADFCNQNAHWLNDYALFMALKGHHRQVSWYDWKQEYRQRNPQALITFSEKYEQQIGLMKFMQYLFFRQWADVKKYANDREIKIIGDIPIYISADSVETWTKPEIFLFDENKKPTLVAGVPPDYFSETGQLWGNPIYNWDYHKQSNFAWWKERIKANLELFDIVRIDHFRGFSEFWAVPVGQETAINGEWLPCPGYELFASLKEEFGELPIIAEDLGVITDDVVAMRENFGFPGMKILQFAFDSDEDNDYLPHTYEKNFVVYTGTHDNDTIASWYNLANDKNKKSVHDYLGNNVENGAWDFIKLAHSSVANVSIIPLQDLLNLGNEARMNMPGTTEGNWKWRFGKDDISSGLAKRLAAITKIYGR
ncbi:MAG: 4-alpha-glucanotransferase [Bacteroidota bacterium]|nr:4-alpha-glucanotransferase [Bacteroidota bacterium]